MRIYINHIIAQFVWTICFLPFNFLVYAEEAEKYPNQFICSFNTGLSTSYEEGKFISQPAKDLSLFISKIDLDAQKAELMMLPENTPLSIRIVRAINANHYLEVVNEGFLNLTTVYDKDESRGVYPAVHSRHLGLLGQPVIAHYTGLCKDN